MGRQCGRRGQASDSIARLSPHRAIYFILGIWLDQHHDDFLQPPEFPCLRLLPAYIQVNFPGSSLEHQAQLLLSELKDLQPHEAETEGLEQDQETTQEVTPTASLVPSTEPVPSGGSASPEEGDVQQTAHFGSSEALRARF
ncbi:ral guanine nucleotide dissociation stimulator-like [Pteropus medius]|uniref:ral guanine nucleotide dissociation stimulator-like n=1 Tax=Pteropus vampyrus TaxID=132908 RepID=UPI00196B6024|nr:ral guanine nucleotide dissociation stimulator-like [Pteropus giganteus]